jgi:hypothetical protein
MLCVIRNAEKALLGLVCRHSKACWTTSALSYGTFADELVLIYMHIGLGIVVKKLKSFKKLLEK